MDVSVRAPTKSHLPGAHIGKSGCRPQNCHATVSVILYYFYISTPNRFCLTLYDVIKYNDVTSYLSSCD